ncbi:MAG: hypothetical protein MHM6MM_007738 [Cercozoa sp. M6MM]
MRMFLRFFPNADEDAAKFADELATYAASKGLEPDEEGDVVRSLQLSPADLQSYFLLHKEAPDTALEDAQLWLQVRERARHSNTLVDSADMQTNNSNDSSTVRAEHGSSPVRVAAAE